MAAAISRASICCHDSPPCRPMITTLVAGRHVLEACYVHRHHVHRHGTHDWHAAAADQHLAAPGHPQVNTVSVSSGDDSGGHRIVGLKFEAVSPRLRPAARLSPLRRGS
jgi:hypothetical protein